MKAAVFQEAHKPLTIEDVDIIDPGRARYWSVRPARVYVTPICILWMEPGSCQRAVSSGTRRLVWLKRLVRASPT